MYFLHASSTSLQSTFGFTDFRPSFWDSLTISYASLACEEIFPSAKVLVASETYPLYLNVRSVTTRSPFLNLRWLTCAWGNAPFGPPAIINGLSVDL